MKRGTPPIALLKLQREATALQPQRSGLLMRSIAKHARRLENAAACLERAAATAAVFHQPTAAQIELVAHLGRTAMAEALALSEFLDELEAGSEQGVG